MCCFYKSDCILYMRGFRRRFSRSKPVFHYYGYMVSNSFIRTIPDNNSVRFAQLKDRISRMEERERAASDIHDLLGQTLTAISLKTQILAASTQDLTVKAGVEEIHDIAVQGIEQMHHTLNQMRSPRFRRGDETGTVTVRKHGDNM